MKPLLLFLFDSQGRLFYDLIFEIFANIKK